SLAEDGFHINTYGLTPNNLCQNVHISSSVRECISGADVIVLPLPYSVDISAPLEERRINAPMCDTSISVLEVIGGAVSGTFIFAGKADEEFTSVCKAKDILVFDYATRPEFSVLNAVPTAEGAIEVAMSNTPFTIHGSRCLVIGYGKIGKVLSADLRFLGAEVTASARNCSDLAWISANGYRSVRTSQIADIADEFDIIFNTVPHMVLNFRVLSKTKPDVLIIDLASKPGGVDFGVARELGRRAITALSLPGKVAPESAGLIIKDTIINILEELGV
ncbi:MAG: dipicolinate synthase subunit DpsA, partial [Clostridia bacterium]|nr:dipicolinate synthase subunit DpsA [Clostridia bacterium]